MQKTTVYFLNIHAHLMHLRKHIGIYTHNTHTTFIHLPKRDKQTILTINDLAYKQAKSVTKDALISVNAYVHLCNLTNTSASNRNIKLQLFG